MMNFLFCSAGRRCQLIKNMKESLGTSVKIVVTDAQKTAPSLYVADKKYLVPKITDNKYISRIIEICKDESVHALTTLIDPEISLLAQNKKLFEKNGIQLLVPQEKSAEICFDKYKMYKYLKKNNIDTPETFVSISDFLEKYKNKKIKFPVFVKPRTGSGSVGAKKILTIDDLVFEIKNNKNLIIQEFMDGLDLDADIYCDIYTHKPVCIFQKRKLETKIGGANKTISYFDNSLTKLILKITSLFEFSGAINCDFFYCDGKYYLSEINPRFGGGYLHTYSAGYDFYQQIYKNIILKQINELDITPPKKKTMMMMYDAIIIENIENETDI